MMDGMPAVFEQPIVISPRKLAKRSKSIINVHQSRKHNNFALVTVFKVKINEEKKIIYCNLIYLYLDKISLRTPEKQ